MTSLSISPSGSRSRELLALVRWLNGEHAGTLTPNLRVSWIRNFDSDDFSTTDSYIVEWRRAPKPKTGWPLYDCCVLEVSFDVEFLRMRMRSISEDGSGNSFEETPTTSRRGDSSDPPILREILNTLRNNLAGQGSQGQSSLRSTGSFSSSDENQNVVKVGTALVVSNTAYIAAKAAPSPSRMVMTLVRAAFSKRRLRRSSYAGQKRKDALKPGLKKYRKMQDIQDFVKSRFPFITQAAFGSAVNNCTGKNVDKERPRELCDESASEDDMEL